MWLVKLKAPWHFTITKFATFREAYRFAALSPLKKFMIYKPK